MLGAMAFDESEDQDSTLENHFQGFCAWRPSDSSIASILAGVIDAGTEKVYCS
jgi:hypothetical protein